MPTIIAHHYRPCPPLSPLPTHSVADPNTFQIFLSFCFFLFIYFLSPLFFMNQHSIRFPPLSAIGACSGFKRRGSVRSTPTPGVDGVHFLQRSPGLENQQFRQEKTRRGQWHPNQHLFSLLLFLPIWLQDVRQVGLSHLLTSEIVNDDECFVNFIGRSI